ncbi:ABC transporter permease subunit [Paenibacillus mucilaginosus]|uniref:Binding-protein-dependent transport systems inner membrane component n=2 Tax=Paenibacillus mucilaginosus TaxID=61624 RepID=F8FQP8_PAEMK|nr:ABC transporter permease subunit [Paenibacillus mucilaginosus]AEI40403.1 binding-protein-dependent transport systems inner membrane component [Paenibacillus mucilaginosus KNP414]MCG7213249.1 ABC transporter permease subunit [Paenibacillus mucilaginosus]WDM29588.1 sugar ABC transporter permease [Paenibacillus mucilaginosus]
MLNKMTEDGIAILDSVAKPGKKRAWMFQLPLHLMILPGLILILVYSYGPILGAVIAFQDFNPARGIFDSEWNGLDNIRYVMALPGSFQIIWNTLIIAVMKIVVGLIVPVVVALLLNEIRKELFKRTVQTLIYLPHFLSWIILGGVLIDILSPTYGLVNQMLNGLGLDSIYFLGSNDWFRSVLVTSDVWKEFGFNTIVYLAALTGINPTLYEAAVIDGANRWKQTLYVTLPGMAPIIILTATLALGQVLNAGFDQVYNLYSPQVYETGDIIDTFVYRIGIVDAQYGVATAVGLFKSVVSLILLSASYFLAYRFANYRIF